MHECKHTLDFEASLCVLLREHVHAVGVAVSGQRETDGGGGGHRGPGGESDGGVRGGDHPHVQARRKTPEPGCKVSESRGRPTEPRPRRYTVSITVTPG